MDPIEHFNFQAKIYKLIWILTRILNKNETSLWVKKRKDFYRNLKLPLKYAHFSNFWCWAAENQKNPCKTYRNALILIYFIKNIIEYSLDIATEIFLKIIKWMKKVLTIFELYLWRKIILKWISQGKSQNKILFFRGFGVKSTFCRNLQVWGLGLLFSGMKSFVSFFPYSRIQLHSAILDVTNIFGLWGAQSQDGNWIMDATFLDLARKI